MKLDLPRAFLLDLDDTILDDSGNVSHCWREACFAHEAELTVPAGALFETIERTRSWFWSDPERHRVGRLDLDAARREVVRASLAELGVENAPALAEKIADQYRLRRHEGLEPLEDAIETVRWLRESGCRLALLTNGAAAAQRSKVVRFALADWFDVILIEGELGFGKPDPRVYRMALEGLGAEPAETWMAGDNLEWDVAAPQRLGIYALWIDRGAKGLPPGCSTRPDRVIRSLSELRAIAAPRRTPDAAAGTTPPSTPA